MIVIIDHSEFVAVAVVSFSHAGCAFSSQQLGVVILSNPVWR